MYAQVLKLRRIWVQKLTCRRCVLCAVSICCMSSVSCEMTAAGGEGVKQVLRSYTRDNESYLAAGEDW